MRRVANILEAGAFNEARVIDRVVLDAHGRHRRRVVLTGESKASYLLDLPQARLLNDGDGLVLDDGSVVRVASLAEPLAEIEARTSSDLIRLAWHLGNHHTEVEVIGHKLRIRRDHVLEAMVRRLGGTVTHVEAPFAPGRDAREPHTHHGHGDHDHG